MKQQSIKPYTVVQIIYLQMNFVDVCKNKVIPENISVTLTSFIDFLQLLI